MCDDFDNNNYSSVPAPVSMIEDKNDNILYKD